MTSVIEKPASTPTGRLNLSVAREVVSNFFGSEDRLEPAFKGNAEIIFMKRFPRKGSDGEPAETAADALWRVALNVSSVTVLYEKGAVAHKASEVGTPVVATELDFPFRTIARQYNWMLKEGHKLKKFDKVVTSGVDAWLSQASAYYDNLAALVFIPNSPTWTGAGTPLGQLAACFVLPIEDSLVAGDSNIMKTLRDAVAIQKTGGGNGFSFGRLRPAKTRVSTSMGEATGVVGFLSMFNGVFEHIRQGGSRRGANMGVCPVWHPDVVSFINSKTIEGKIENFNISVGITGAFMEAVDEGSDWNFHFPGPDGPMVPIEWNGEMVDSVPAKDLYDLIITNAHIIGDPGALFLDEANKYNPNPKWYELESTNPCGEQWLGPYENCCLGSIAIHHFVRADKTFDWEAFRKVIVVSTEFLDDVVDANTYVESVPELEIAAQGGRRIGLGLMGVADALVKMGLRYGSDDGLDFASQVQEFNRYHTMLASIDRAKARGTFPRIEESIYDPTLLKKLGPGAAYSGTKVDGVTPYIGNLWQIPVGVFVRNIDFGRPKSDWIRVWDLLIAHGIRNSAQNTFAPTGTIASVAGVEGYGCEPVFALAFVRTMMQEGQNIELPYLSDLFREALVEYGVSEDLFEVIASKVKANGGSCQGIDEVPESIRHFMVVTADLTYTEHVRMQAVLQAYVDNSISKTVNLPNGATVKDVDDTYRLAFNLHCKGITVYRQGSRQLEVLSTKAATTGAVEVVDSTHWPIIRPLPIPADAETDGMPSTTYTVRTPFGKMRATITEHPEHRDRPFDIGVGIGRGGTDVNAFTEAIGRVVSIALRGGIDPGEVADQLIGIGGSTQELTLRPDKSQSLPDALGKLLRRHYEMLQERASGEIVTIVIPAPEKTPDLGIFCPECLHATFVRSEACMQCKNPDCLYEQCK